MDWKGLQVGAPEVEVPAELVDQQLEALRFAVAELAPAEGAPRRRATRSSSTSSPKAERRSATTWSSLESAGSSKRSKKPLVGMAPGETKQVEYTLAEGQSSTVEVTLKDLKEKILPPLDDDLARSASEFDTLEELRADIEQRIREQIEEEVESGFRAAAADALVDASRIQPAGPLVEARTRELVSGLIQSLERRGISLETYIAVTNQSPQDLEARLRGEAARSVARELALEAVADKAGLEVTDDEVREFIREHADEEGEAAEEVVERVFTTGRHELLRDDLRMRKALDLVVAEVERIPLELAEAREKLWTPEKGAAAPETKLWTPGSDKE